MEVKTNFDFIGFNFLEYINVQKFKETVAKELDYESEKMEDFADYYSGYLNEKKDRKIDSILFEHIFYGQLKNIFLHKISPRKNSMKVSNFKRQVGDIFKKYSSDNIPQDILRQMTTDGFNVISRLNLTKTGTKFIAGYDFKNNDKQEIERARFLIGQVVLREKKEGGVRPVYLLGGLEIDYKQNICMVLVRGLTGLINEEDEDEETGTSMTAKKFHDEIKNNFFPRLHILPRIDPQLDREGMYEFFKSLFSQMISEASKKIEDTFENELVEVSDRFFNSLGEIGEQPIRKDRDDFQGKLQALLLGVYVSNNIDSNTLVRKAKELGLVGYPTKISYKNTKSNKSSTGTSAAKNPIAASDTLYSLYTDVENAKELHQWSLSWFTDMSDPKSIDVYQTTVYITSKNFRVIFKARSHLDKEFIYHVIGTINQQRKY